MADGADMPTQVCRVCGDRKPLTTEFWSGRDRQDGTRLLHRRCRTCDAAASRARWAVDPEARVKDKASRNARRDEIRAYDRMRGKRDRPKRKAKFDAWAAKNPERNREIGRAASARRRARAKEIGGTWSMADLKRAVAAQKGRCWWCGKRLGKRFHADHRIPLAREGSNGPGNIVAACPPCNHAKGAKMPWEFAGRLL